MRNIRSEINFCMGNQPHNISLINLCEIQSGNRGYEQYLTRDEAEKVDVITEYVALLYHATSMSSGTSARNLGSNFSA